MSVFQPFLPRQLPTRCGHGEVAPRAKSTVRSISVVNPTYHIENEQCSLLSDPRPAKLPLGYWGRLGAGGGLRMRGKLKRLVRCDRCERKSTVVQCFGRFRLVGCD